MAILSNINGKFAVDSSGGIQFSGQTGTSGYVLKSNGNAAPTWVAPSAIIGGPYLPLTGGTLTGPLIGTSAAFSGNLSAIAGTFAGNVTLTNGVLESFNAQPMYFFSTPTVSNYELLSIDKLANGNARLRVYKSGSGSFRGFEIQTGGSASLTIDSLQNATFAGDVIGGTTKTLKSWRRLQTDANNDWGLNNNAGSGVISVSGMGTPPTSLTTIAGKLGIGVSPTFNLDVLSNGSSIRLNSGDANGSYITWANNGTAKGYMGSAYHLFASPYNLNTDIAIRAVGGLGLSSNDATSPTLYLNTSGNVILNTATALDFQVEDFAQIKFRESGAITIDSDNNQSSRNFAIKDGSGTNLLVIQDTGNATFAGSVAVGGDKCTILEESTEFKFVNANVNSGYQFFTRNASSSYIEALVLNGPGNATFAGSIEVGTGNSVINGDLYFGVNADIFKTGTLTITATSAIQFLNDANNQYTGYFYNSDTGSGANGLNVQTATTAATAYAFRVNSGSNTNALTVMGTANVGIGTNAPVTRLEVDSSQANSTIKTGGLEMQSYAVNNSWYAENLYYNNGWKLRSAGSATQMYMEAGVISFKRAAAGSAGASVSPLTTMVLNSNGNVGIGTGIGTNSKLMISDASNRTFGDAQFKIEGNGYTAVHYLDSTEYMIQQNSASRRIRIMSGTTNGVLLNPGATAWVSGSDIKLKENIKPLKNVLDKIQDYRCVEYNFKNDKDKKIGFIAQDWKNDFPAIIDEDKDGLLGMKYTETIPVLLKAIQELEARIKILENK